MAGTINTLLDTGMQVLALVGAIVLLFTVFLCRLAIGGRLTADSSGGTQTLRYELNRQFLLFTLLVLAVVTLVIQGVTIPLALSVAFGLMLVAIRWIWAVVLFVAGSLVLLVILQLLAR